ncbi:Uncharacterized protein LSUE1_G006652 [Lachnellula suecica]|uniref:Secreted beta-glucosidase adg3 n=1 Tax=Lachnellula suecica TaxID=602035 RepID=A0A8T9BZM5_9HELO|nr:Uncharacterized protein LSUE1_G006652 [Lachnellula suecica]
MKLLDIQTAIGAAILVLSVPADANHGHGLSHLDTLGRRHNHQRLHASPKADGIKDGLKKRGQCQFPTNAGLVAVPGASNGGWAMSPDQSCTPGNYCPYACPSGQVMAQWDPKATSYTYPMSMNGGLHCDNNGQISKPFPNKDYCVDGTGAVGVQNNAASSVAFCQTVLPGNEAMLIPTGVESWSQLAVPGPSYWCETAAHYYINPPGVSTADGCVWSDGSKPIGNWAPYVAGANTDNSGNTFVKIGWNPIWTGCSLSKTPPTFGVKITCSGSGCNGTPCSIDPSVNGVGGVTSSDQSSGAGGANFCVVTVPKGQTANVVVFDAGNSAGGSSGSSSSSIPDPHTDPNSLVDLDIIYTYIYIYDRKLSLQLFIDQPDLKLSFIDIFVKQLFVILNFREFKFQLKQLIFRFEDIIQRQNVTSATLTAPIATGTGGSDSDSANVTALSTVPSPTAAKKNGAETAFISGSTIMLGAAFALASAYLL